MYQDFGGESNHEASDENIQEFKPTFVMRVKVMGCPENVCAFQFDGSQKE
jgi:hypothetical protein